MKDLLRDAPGVAWVLTAISVARVVVMAGVVLGFGQLIDARATPPWSFFLTVAAAAALLVIENTAPFRFRARQEAAWRRRLAEINLQLDPDTRRDDAAVVTEATDATAKASVYTISFLGPYLAAIIAPPLVLLILGWQVSWPIAGWLLIGLAAIPPIMGWARRSLKGAGAGYGRASGQLAGVFLESVRTLGTTFILNATAARHRAIAGSAERMRSTVMGLLYRNQVMILVTDGVFGIATTTVAAALALHGLVSGSLTTGGAIVVVLLARLLIDPVNRMGRTFYTGMAGKMSLRLVNRALAYPTRSGEHVAHGAASGDIIVQDLSVIRDGDGVVSDVNLSIPTGSHTAIIGPSGAGKSSLALALCGLKDFTGTISFGGTTVDSAQLRASVSYVPQSTTLFSGTVADNLDLAGRGVPREELEQVLQQANLGALGGSDTRIGETGRALSGGEAARVSIARGLIANKAVLVLDESTANLDEANAELVRRTARETGATLVEITHRAHEALDADQVVVLEAGLISVSGTPEQVRSTSTFFAHALNESPHRER